MNKKIEKGSAEFKMWADAYKMREKYLIPEDTEKYWEDFIYAQSEFEDKYAKTEVKYLARFISRAIFAQCEIDHKKALGVDIEAWLDRRKDAGVRT